MKMVSKATLAAVMITAVWPGAGAAEKGRFEPRDVSAYAARQKAEKVTIAIEPYDGGEKVKEAFGKVDPAKLGVLPVLMLVVNDSDRALQLDRMRVQFITADRQIVDSVPAADLQRSGPVKPPDLGGRSPFPGIGRGRKQSKEEWEIGAREFVAPVVPAQERAHGFFYFRVAPSRIAGSKVYITGIRDAGTGQELLYFEISLDDYVKNR